MKISTAEIKELLKDCVDKTGKCTPEDFRRYIDQKSDKEYTDGQLAGAIRQLSEKGELLKIERGIYVKGSRTGFDGNKCEKAEESKDSEFAIEIAKCFDDTAKRLSSIVENMDILDMDKRDFSLL